MPEFDQLAELYDETRGGEGRGEQYAADLALRLPREDGPILEVGVGTGVVALGLVRLGYRIVGLDVSSPMLSRARARLGPVVILGDGMELPLASASVAHAVSVWVIHAVAEPVRLFSEVARVLRPGGRYVVCTAQRPKADDAIGQIIDRMGGAVEARRTSDRPRQVTAVQVLDWAGSAGFTGEVHQLDRVFRSSPALELDAIARRAWPALRQLDEDQIEEVTRPAIEALSALPEAECERRTTTELLVLRREGIA